MSKIIDRKLLQESLRHFGILVFTIGTIILFMVPSLRIWQVVVLTIIGFISWILGLIKLNNKEEKK